MSERCARFAGGQELRLCSRDRQTAASKASKRAGTPPPPHLVAHAVGVLHAAAQHDRARLKPAVGVVGEAGGGPARVVVVVVVVFGVLAAVVLAVRRQ